MKEEQDLISNMLDDINPFVDILIDLQDSDYNSPDWTLKEIPAKVKHISTLVERLLKTGFVKNLKDFQDKLDSILQIIEELEERDDLPVDHADEEDEED